MPVGGSVCAARAYVHKRTGSLGAEGARPYGVPACARMHWLPLPGQFAPRLLIWGASWGGEARAVAAWMNARNSCMRQARPGVRAGLLRALAMECARLWAAHREATRSTARRHAPACPAAQQSASPACPAAARQGQGGQRAREHAGRARVARMLCGPHTSQPASLARVGCCSSRMPGPPSSFKATVLCVRSQHASSALAESLTASCKPEASSVHALLASSQVGRHSRALRDDASAG